MKITVIGAGKWGLDYFLRTPKEQSPFDYADAVSASAAGSRNWLRLCLQSTNVCKVCGVFL